MTIMNQLTTNCVVKDSPENISQDEKKSADPTNCEIIEPMRRLMALGLTEVEIEGHGLDLQTLQAICEYARLDECECRSSADAIETTLCKLEKEMQACEMESEMLCMRKRALKRRAKLLAKLAHLLERREKSPL